MPQALISPECMTKPAVEYCVTIYPSILTRVYAKKHPKLSQAEALKEDTWRYETLPGSVKLGEGLTTKQLARLVKWKITHGINRPFLPSMVAKNTEAEISQHSSRASTILSDLDPTTHPNLDGSRYKITASALDEVCKLKGVGPATGTLVLSVYDPVNVPFFADELFAWVVGPGAEGAGGGDKGFDGKKLKLKYDRKEYRALWEGVRGVVERVGGGEVTVTAQEVEQVAYVLMHADLLSEDEQAEFMRLAKEMREAEKPDETASEAGEEVQTLDQCEHKATGVSEKPVPHSGGTRKRKAQQVKSWEPAVTPRRSKRGKM